MHRGVGWPPTETFSSLCPKCGSRIVLRTAEESPWARHDLNRLRPRRSGDSFTAIRTEPKATLHLFSACGTGLKWSVLQGAWLRPARFVKVLSAAVTFQKKVSPLDRDQGDKKEAQVMIDPFEPG
jgi:hypothetical protein